jgi:hypothetical protein
MAPGPGMPPSVIRWPQGTVAQMPLQTAHGVFFPEGTWRTTGCWTDDILDAWAAEDVELAARAGSADAPLALVRCPPQERLYGFTLCEAAQLIYHQTDGRQRVFYDVHLVMPGVTELDDPLAPPKTAAPAPPEPTPAIAPEQTAKKVGGRGKHGPAPATRALIRAWTAYLNQDESIPAGITPRAMAALVAEYASKQNIPGANLIDPDGSSTYDLMVDALAGLRFTPGG